MAFVEMLNPKPETGGAAAKARASQMQGFRGGGPDHMQQMMMQGGPEAAEFLQAEAMAAAFHEDLAGVAMNRPMGMMDGPMARMGHGGAFAPGCPMMGGAWADEFGPMGPQNPGINSEKSHL